MLTCVPSYGRDYKTQKEVKAAWAEGKDFTVSDMSSPYDGRQINKQDADRDKVSVHIYYARRTKSIFIAA